MTNQAPLIKEISCQSALNKLKRKIPYGWDLNIYRGCEHGCSYCYAMYSHDYLGNDDFFEHVYVKTNVIDVLESELRNPKWSREIINIGGVTDSYQPCEADYNIMPEILKLLIKYKTPAIISTKSDLILRDYDLIDQLSRITYVNVAATITTMDEEIRRLIELNGSDSLARFEMLTAFRRTNASVGLHVMPIIPFLTDNIENLEAICSLGNKAKIHYMLPGTLYLRGKTRKYFFEFMKNKFPAIYDEFYLLYKKGGADKVYKERLYKTINMLREKYALSSSYSNPIKEKIHQNSNLQLSIDWNDEGK